MFKQVLDIILSNDVLLYFGIVTDGIVSFLLWKKSKVKSSNSTNAVDEDIQALIEYHETVAQKLKEKPVQFVHRF